MADKVQTLKRERVRECIGVVTREQMQSVDGALRLWLRL